METPVVIKEKASGTVLQIVLYFMAFLAIIYVLYKLFGLFKNVGNDVKKKIHDIEHGLHEAGEMLNPSDLPNKVTQTVEDVKTIAEGVLKGKTNTPEYNTAMNDLHYGGAEWGPGAGVGLDSKFKEGYIKKYGETIKPGESKTFAGGTYLETVVNDQVKCPYANNQVMTKEECLARKYGFDDYAVFSAWLKGVKTALKASGKDPNSMSLDAIVAYGKKLDEQVGKWSREHRDDFTLTTWDNGEYKTNEELGRLWGERWEAIAKYEKTHPPKHVLPVVPKRGPGNHVRVYPR